MPPKRKPAEDVSSETEKKEKKTKAEEKVDESDKKSDSPTDLGAWLEELFAKKKLEELAEKGKTGDYKEYEELFLAITDRLFNQCVLVVNGRAHRFIEVEFYYKFPSHPDPFTHCHSVQSEWGKWYFHRMGHGSNTYKAGSYKGLDISFGGQTSKDEKKKAWGGILIRGIQPLFDFTPTKAPKGKLKEYFVEGPCNVVDHILTTAKCDSIEKFTSAHFKGSETSPPAIASAKHGSEMFYLRPPTDSEKKKIQKKQKIYANPRVGLSLKRSLEHGPEFLLKGYRYHCLPGSITKGKQHMILALHSIYKLPAVEISRLTSTAAGTINKYIDQFKKGQKSSKSLDDMGSAKKLTTDDFNQMYGKWAATYNK